ncbi:PEP-CTERM sorting domain-containing protein [Duganella sp. BJB1802]|uniref:PEP-CTERM sorting domain-containing protein n=1 Tax=Duganella sp. BJB1802 TaxID=2744575 RepID=UPI001594194B|nr:PEP-CTERM sorting domain-containing protein [Duganella sp. BJB1802]NVD71619.1 PEP-CTERM sorting domain-containing protein [Duganella sp. BJB1802]
MKAKNFLRSVVLISAALAASAQASTYSFSFPTSSSTVVASIGSVSPTEIGYFWSMTRGDAVSQSYVGSGVFGTTNLELDLNVTRNVLSSGASVQWDVLVNGQDVGDWNVTQGSGTGINHLSLNFGAVGGEFNSLALVVKNNVPSGQGSIALGLDTRGSVTAVPEPETYGMLLGGLAVVGLMARRKRA